MTLTPDQLSALDAAADAATGKSLGEKLYEATYNSECRFPWSDLNGVRQDDFERTAIAFAASLSHDETASATIKALVAEVRRLRAALEPFALDLNSKYDDGEPFRSYFSVAAVRRARAALTKGPDQ